jgi:histidine triad (HIT) family protein
MTYDDQNIFAKILRGEIPSEVLYEDDASYAMMDIMPWSDGHCLVISKEPARNILDISPDALADVAKTVQKMAIATKKAFNADGVTIRQNNEAAGFQEVFHIHFHIIPTFDGVALRRVPAPMMDMDVMKEHAAKIKNALL